MREAYDVFISYGGPDREWAEALARGIQARGMRVFLDLWDIRLGDQVIAKLQAALNDAQTYVIIFGDSSERPWATAEREASLRKLQ